MPTITRDNYRLREKFPPISEFPDYHSSGANVAIVARLFCPANVDAWRPWFNLALWSMRSRIFNSDMQKYNATFFFHVVQSQYEAFYKDAFEKSKVPQRAILIYPDDMVTLAAPRYILGYAVSPLLDERLDEFDYVIVIDADMFALKSSSGDLFPLVETSINDFSEHEIGLQRSWVEEKDKTKAVGWFKGWVRCSPLDESEWIRKASEYCATSPETLGKLLLTSNWNGWEGFAGHCGAYIRIPTHIYQRLPEFRPFIKRASQNLGHEEMALGLWYIKHYLETGERCPKVDFPTVSYARGARMCWDPEACHAARDKPRQWHLTHYPTIDNYIYQLAEEVGASDEERNILSGTVISEVTELRNKTDDTTN